MNEKYIFLQVYRQRFAMFLSSCFCRHEREIVPHVKIDKYQHSGSHLYEVYEESPPAIYVDIKYVFGNYKTLCLYRDYDVKSIYKVNIFTLARQ